MFQKNATEAAFLLKNGDVKNKKSALGGLFYRGLQSFNRSQIIHREILCVSSDSGHAKSTHATAANGRTLATHVAALDMDYSPLVAEPAERQLPQICR